MVSPAKLGQEGHVRFAIINCLGHLTIEEGEPLGARPGGWFRL